MSQKPSGSPGSGPGSGAGSAPGSGRGRGPGGEAGAGPGQGPGQGRGGPADNPSGGFAANLSGSFSAHLSGSYPAGASGSFAGVSGSFAGVSGTFPAGGSGSFPAAFSDSQPEQSPISGEPRPEPGQHALVIGCGIAGMTAAAVLAKYFQRVTIVERDQLPDQPKFRAGKPQGRHAHILLGQGLHHMEGIFPGLTEDLHKAGALACRWGPDTRWYHFGGWRQRYPASLTTVSCSVNLIEWALRRRLHKNPQIRIFTECTVNELLADGARVIGLRLQHHRRGRGQKAIELHGSLVVDATGRRSMAPEWLSKLGIGPLPETKVDAFWGYASRYYERPSQAGRDFVAMAIHPTPPDSPRMGVLFPLENNLWLATLAGTNRDYPPDDDAGFLEFARGLAQPDLFEAIREAKPISGIYGYRYAENRLRHFDRLKRSPEGFIALGDAVCQFNPVYGQGMTVAALGGVLLDRCLRAHLRRHPGRDMRGLARTYQRRLSQALRVPWLIATNEDLRYAKSDVPAKRRLSVRLLQGFVRSLLELGVKDFLAFRSFVLVMHLVSSPLRLLHPLLLLKVMVHALFARRPAPAPRPARMLQPVTPAAMSPRPTSGEAWPALNDPSLLSSLKSSATPTPTPLPPAAAQKSAPTPSGGTPTPLALRKPAAKYAVSEKDALRRP